MDKIHRCNTIYHIELFTGTKVYTCVH